MFLILRVPFIHSAHKYLLSIFGGQSKLILHSTLFTVEYQVKYIFPSSLKLTCLHIIYFHLRSVAGCLDRIWCLWIEFFLEVVSIEGVRVITF